MKYCNQCSQALELRVPPDDDRERYICLGCGHIHYQNPRIIVCAVPCYEDKVLLCKRAIEPRYGYWTVPGGFMENGETTEAGALRETHEEAGAKIEIESIYGLYNLPHIDQVHIFFLATLLDLDFSAGVESLEVELFSYEQIPWKDIAFPAVSDTLRRYFADRKNNHFPMHSADILVADNNERIIRPH